MRRNIVIGLGVALGVLVLVVIVWMNLNLAGEVLDFRIQMQEQDLEFRAKETTAKREMAAEKAVLQSQLQNSQAEVGKLEEEVDSLEGSLQEAEEQRRANAEQLAVYATRVVELEMTVETELKTAKAGTVKEAVPLATGPIPTPVPVPKVSLASDLNLGEIIELPLGYSIRKIEIEREFSFTDTQHIGPWDQKIPTDGHAWTQWSTSFGYEYTRTYTVTEGTTVVTRTNREYSKVFFNCELLPGYFHLGMGSVDIGQEKGLGFDYGIEEFALFMDGVGITLLDRADTKVYYNELIPPRGVTSKPRAVIIAQETGEVLFEADVPFEIPLVVLEGMYWKEQQPMASHLITQNFVNNSDRAGRFPWLNLNITNGGVIDLDVGGGFKGPEGPPYVVYIDNYRKELTDPDGDGVYPIHESPLDSQGRPKFSVWPTILVYEPGGDGDNSKLLFYLKSPVLFIFRES